MFTNRFFTWTIVFVVAIALISLLTVNTYLVQGRGEVLALGHPIGNCGGNYRLWNSD